MLLRAPDQIVPDPPLTKPHPFLELPAVFFETKWMKPDLGACRFEDQETLLDAVFFDTRYVFHLPAGKYLPDKIIVHASDGLTEVLLSDYSVQSSGLTLPKRSRSIYGSLPAPTYTVTYEINPPYNPKLRELDLRQTANPDGWRKPREDRR